MPIDFHAKKNRHTYAIRTVDPGWGEMMTSILNPNGKRIIDIGCGGGIYSHAWNQLGAASIIGIDFSEQQVQMASGVPCDATRLSFRKGDALATGLPDGSADIVFERALIHHIADLRGCFREAYRLLAPQGVYIIQECTPDDVLLPGSPEHIGGYYFERFPRLSEIEKARRPQKAAVIALLKEEGFLAPATVEFWETRRIHPNFPSLAEDMKKRVARSILHELSDAELTDLLEFIGQRLPKNKAIVEKDRWTIWAAKRD